MPILSNNAVTRPLSSKQIEACNFITHAALTDTRNPAVLLPAVARQPHPDGQPQRHQRRRRREPEAPAVAGRRAAPQVPHAQGRRVRVLVVGVGRRQPRHDAAHRPARSEADALLCAGLRRQRRVVLGACRPAHGAMDRRQSDAMSTCRSSTRRCRSACPRQLRVGVFAPFRRLGQRMLYHWYYLRDEAL